MDGKKISFGFSKIVKKPQLISAPRKEEKVELIECLEGQEIKISGKTSPVVSAPLVIPLKNGTSPLDRLVQEKKSTEKPAQEAGNVENAGPKEEETLEQRAAREIIEGLQEANNADEQKTFAVPLKADELPLDGAVESTMDDYEDVPIQQFGLAMLRGMGWKDEEHKEKKIEEIVVCRPKGLGLGADKVVKSTKPQSSSSATNQEDLKVKKGAFVKILGGKFANKYGQVEGIDEETGRINVKLALGGRESISEYLVEAVTEKEYQQNRKVINVEKYEEYKKKQEDSERNKSSHHRSSSSRQEKNSRRERSRSRERQKSPKLKSKKKHRRDSSSSESADERHRRRHTSSRRDRDDDHRDSRKSSKSSHRDR
uniref:KOW domain-containing protein n=2 Tax=Lutzomyia longipalpis TaxID=7200 RepID=A0A1B0GLJ1_LUTLO